MSLQYETVEGALATANKFAVNDAAVEFLKEADTVRGVRIVHQQWGIGGGQVANRSGGAATIGIGVHLDPSQWVAWQWVHATTTYTDDTTDAQDAGASDFAMETTTNDDGHLIACRVPFNIIGYLLGTASASATNTVRVVEFSHSNGTWASYAAAAMIVEPVNGAAAWPSGERAVWFPIRTSWAPMTAAHVADASLHGFYGIRIRATTAPTTTAAVATQFVLGRMYLAQEAVGDNAIADFELASEIVMAGAHIAFAVSRDTATANVTNDSGSIASILVRPRG